MQQSRLLELLAEILNYIVELAVTRPRPIWTRLPFFKLSDSGKPVETYKRLISNDDLAHPASAPPIAGVSRVLRSIALPIFCSSNIFLVFRADPYTPVSPGSGWFNVNYNVTFGCTFSTIAHHLQSVIFFSTYVTSPPLAPPANLIRPRPSAFGGIKASIARNGTLLVEQFHSDKGIPLQTINAAYPKVLGSQGLAWPIKCRCGAPNPGVEGYDGLNLVDLVRDCQAWVDRDKGDIVSGALWRILWRL
jgi:hypothetical protein